MDNNTNRNVNINKNVNENKNVNIEEIKKVSFKSGFWGGVLASLIATIIWEFIKSAI